jgi:pilus assembly protein CpaD
MRNLKFLTVVAASIALQGCAGALGTSNNTMYSAHQPVVERTNFAIDLTTNGGAISSAEKSRLNEWFEALKLGYGDRISVDYGSEYANPLASAAIARIAADRGLITEEVAPVTPGQIAPGTLRIVVTRSKASVPSCPDWTSNHDRNYNSSNHSNYGCATNSNLAAMVADPEDLVRGRENSKLDGNSGKKAVDAYKAKTGGN